MKPTRILFFTDNFPPESNAPANRTYEHCIEWVKKGAEVTVITCNPNFPKGEVFPGYKNKLYRKEMMDGIKVVRVWSYITPNRGTVKRILDYISYAFASFLASFFHKADVIVATSPQLFTVLGGHMAAMVKRKPLVMEVRDLWPESIKAVSAIESNSILDRLEKLVTYLYRSAHRIVVVTDSFKERIAAEGIDADKIEVIKNGVNPQRYFPQDPNQQLIEKLQLQGKFVVGYIGTHGMAHNLNFILECAAELTDSEIHFLFVGEGAYKGRMVNLANELGLTNVTMLDSIDREEVPNYISITDVALVPLRKSDTFKTVIPSKIFENAAMGKPILLGVEGEAQQLLESYRAGLCFEPENKADFLKQLGRLKNDASEYEACQNGCFSMADEFNRKVLAERMLEILMNTIQSRATSPNAASNSSMGRAAVRNES